MNRKRLAAALAYVDEKAKRLTSLDQPKESDAVDMALEMGGSFIPGVGQALAARDFERARRAGDEAGMGMAAASALPVGRLIGALKGFDPVMREIDVYHGSPHRFDEFDASKIGTGEGAQAYGHGIYLAESPKVAKEYATKLGRVVSSIDNNPTKDVYEEWAVSALKNFPEPEKAKAYFQNLVDVGLLKGKGSNEVRAYVSSVNDAIDKAAGKKVGQAIQGNLYTADLPDEMVDRMLDYDASIKSQPENIRNALQPLLDKHGIARTADIGTLISAMGRDMPQSMVSEKLRELGIPGIKYLDAGSRGQGGSGTRNFVVFPGEEKKVTILERDGKKLANALKATAAQKQDVEVNLYPVRNQPNVMYLSKIEVPQGQRGQGIGSSVMQDIINQADADGKTITLTPSTAYGATSTKRLKDFYKRFGFVENSGRNKNYALNETMYRLPRKPKE